MHTHIPFVLFTLIFIPNSLVTLFSYPLVVVTPSNC